MRQMTMTINKTRRSRTPPAPAPTAMTTVVSPSGNDGGGPVVHCHQACMGGGAPTHGRCFASNVAQHMDYIKSITAAAFADMVASRARITGWLIATHCQTLARIAETLSKHSFAHPLTYDDLKHRVLCAGGQQHTV